MSSRAVHECRRWAGELEIILPVHWATYSVTMIVIPWREWAHAHTGHLATDEARRITRFCTSVRTMVILLLCRPYIILMGGQITCPSGIFWGWPYRNTWCTPDRCRYHYVDSHSRLRQYYQILLFGMRQVLPFQNFKWSSKDYTYVYGVRIFFFKILP